jgi:ribosomal protein L40E
VPNKKPTIQESNLKGTCAVCGSVNPENSKFCMKCGRSLDGNSGNYCSRCGTSNMTGAAFCKECGQNMVMINTPPQYQGPAKNYDGLNPLEFLLIVFFSPIAGLIGFVAWHDTKPRKAKISLIIAIIMFFIFVPILMLYLNWRAQMDYYDSLYYPYCVLTSFYAL